MSPKQKDSDFGIIFTHMCYLPKGRKLFKKGSNDSVFGDSCQRGREHEPKAKGPRHHLILKRVFSIGKFQIGTFCVQKGKKLVFSKMIS
jgi:hypothetical protein